MFCPQCGMKAVEGAVFCQKCGARLPIDDAGAQPNKSAVDIETTTDNFDVTLTNTGENKMSVIKAVKELTGLGLREAKELVENAPSLLKRPVTQEEAEGIKQMMTKVGATVLFIDRRGQPVDIAVHCKMCGATLDVDCDTCATCGCPIEIPSIESDYVTEQSEQENGDSDQIPTSEKEPSLFEKWWASCSKTKRILVVLGAILVVGFILYALVSFLREFGYLLFGIAVIGGFIYTLITGSKEEKIETRKTIVQMVMGIVIICAVAYVIVLKPDFISNIFQPGASVRNAYLTQYSESVTVEEAFNNFFDHEKWSTYESDEYSQCH